MTEAVRQGLTSFAVFCAAAIVVRVIIDVIDPGFALIPHGERALELAGIAGMVGIFGGVRKIESR